MKENMITAMARIMAICKEENLTPSEAITMFEILKTGLYPQV